MTLAVLTSCGRQTAGIPARTAGISGRTLVFPTAAGLNYGEPRTSDGQWAGTRWLRPGGYWARVQPAFDRDLGLIERLQLGKVLRLFVGLDQLMVWDPVSGYAGFDPAALDNVSTALDMLDRHQLRALLVLYDQEEVASAGNFHFQALDGAHQAMRAGYLRATEEFMSRFGSRPTVVAWDLFNEAYGSLTADGGLQPPPGPDPVSPGYSRATVQSFLRDLYAAARRGAPNAWLTVSDAAELYWHHPPDVSIYDGIVDFYDIHVYDDRPAYPDWRRLLSKPYIVGEAGASVTGEHFEDQRLNPPVLSYLLEKAPSAGVSLVLAQGRAVTPSGDLTPTGRVVSDFLRSHPPAPSPHA